MDGTHPHVELAEDWVIQQNSRQLGWAVSSFPAVSSSPPEHLPRHPHLPGLDTAQIDRRTIAQLVLAPGTPTVACNDARERRRHAPPPVSRHQHTDR